MILAAGMAQPAQAQDEVEPRAEETESNGQPVACVAAQVIVPPFNNTPAAMDQSRKAATVVMRENARAGGKPVRVCQTSAVSPELSRLKHGNEVPVDPEYEPEDDEARAEARTDERGTD